MTFSLSLINSLLLPFCILTVLNFWQTSRNTTLSCQAPVAFSPPATLELSGSATPAPRHLALLLRLGLEGVRQRQRHSRRGFPQINSPQPSSPTWCLLNSVTPPPPPLAGLLVTRVTEEDQDALFFFDILSGKGLNWGAISPSDKSRESFPLFVLVFIYNLFNLMIIYLHIDLWQVSEIFITGMFTFSVFVVYSSRRILRCVLLLWRRQPKAELSGLVTRFKTCLTILYGISNVTFCQYNSQRTCMPFLHRSTLGWTLQRDLWR